MEPPRADQHYPRRLPRWAMLSLAVIAALLTLWTWHKWETVWVERSDAFFPPEWQNEDLEALAWQYPIYRSNDSYQWAYLADALAEGDRLPLRHRFDEGPPEGRPNRWHSGLAYTLRATGEVVATVQDWPTERGIHHAAHWLGSLIHLIALLGGMAAISRLASARAALLFGGVYFFNAAIRWDFAFSRLDHEATFQFFFLFHLIGLAGFVGPNPAPRDSTFPPRQRYALLAGISAGFCWWISATIMTAAASLITLGLLHECYLRQRSSKDNAALYRGLLTWGASSVATIAFFCLLDGRLSPTPSIATLHPIFILVQAGAALVCIAVRHTDKIRRTTTFAIGLLCGLSPLAWLATYGAAAHPWLDPMMRRLHDHIVEFQSPLANGLWAQSETVQAIAVAVLALVALWLNRLKAVRLFIPLVAGLLALSLLQTRWLGLAASAGAIALCLHLPSVRRSPLVYLSMGLIGLSAATWTHKWIKIEEDPGRIFVTDLMLQVGARDINLNLQRLSQGEPVHVAMPFAFAATSALFPEVRPLGTFYWENAEGIRSASNFFANSETTPSIDYVIVQGGRQGAPFAELATWVAQSDHAPETIEQSLAWQLSTQPEPSGWIEIPFFGTFGSQQFSVRIFRP